MNAYRRWRRVAGHPRNTTPDGSPEGAPDRGHTGRVLGIIGVGLAAIAIVVSALAYWQDRAGRIQATRPDLTVVLFEPTMKDQLKAEAISPVDDNPTPLQEGWRGPAVTISVLNSGEEPGLLTQIEVTVRKVWLMNGCWGAGGGRVTAHYDVPLPDELFYFQDAMPLPHVVRGNADFEVAGKDVDTFTVAIGAPSSSEGTWPSLYAVDVTLVERSGGRIFAGQAVLMDQEHAGGGDGVVRQARRGGLLLPDCVRQNAQLLDEVATEPGKHSPEIETWRRGLAEAIAILDASSSPSPAAPSAKPGENAVGTWIVQLQSLPHDRSSATDVERARTETEQRLGLPVQVLNSSDFASLRPGFWVLYHFGGFQDGRQAADVCSAHGIGANADCFGRYLSHEEQDRDLLCFVAASGRPSRCER